MTDLPKNAFPKTYPEDVWEAKQRYMNASSEEKKERLQQYEQVRASYQQNEKMEFVKDRKGKFVKLNPALK